jgi:hypothetical protein
VFEGGAELIVAFRKRLMLSMHRRTGAFNLAEEVGTRGLFKALESVLLNIKASRWSCLREHIIPKFSPTIISHCLASITVNMSYFTYYGKLKDELVVAVLPNGTVEADDPVYIYTEKKAMPYSVRYTSITKDGDDKFTFHDGYYEFEGVATKAYQALSLTRKTISDGQSVTIALSRQYSQPQTVTPRSNGPKIWTGTINFHSWAKEEPFVVVAPKGLGNEKPIVAIWQWTKDDQGVPNTISCSTEKQSSNAASPDKFTFKQAGYYDLTCQVNASSNALAVTIKDATNAAVPQKDLALLPQNTLNAEHRFNPPRGVTTKKTLDCTWPNTKPELPIITEALPFPDDLVDCLAHVAAYVNRAGYHAKYSQKQFDKLDRSFHLAEEKAEKRATTVVKLEGDVTGLKTKNKDLEKLNDALKKEMADARDKGAKREAALREQLTKALDDLRASQGREQKLKEENRALEKKKCDLEEFIKADGKKDAERQKEWDAWKEKDAKEDAAREKKWEEHDKADHEALKQVQKALMESLENVKRLSGELKTKNEKLAELESSLDAAQCELKTAHNELEKLHLELVTELAYKVELRKELEAAKEKLKVAEKNIQYLSQQFAILTEEKAELKRKLESEQYLHKAAQRTLCEANNKISKLNEDLAGLDEQLEGAKTTRREAEEAARAAQKSEKALEEKERELREQYVHDETHHVYGLPSKNADTTITQTEILPECPA